jgi:hypothetical protein
VKARFRASFARDLRRIGNKDLLRQIKETIEQVEKAQTLQDIMNLKSSRAEAIIIESG